MELVKLEKATNQTNLVPWIYEDTSEEKPFRVLMVIRQDR